MIHRVFWTPSLLLKNWVCFKPGKNLGLGQTYYPFTGLKPKKSQVDEQKPGL